MQNIKSDIQHLLEEALKKLEISFDGEIPLEHPANPDHGEWSSSIGLQSYKEQGAKNNYQSPRELAQAVVEELQKLNTKFQLPINNIQIAGPGFINFYLSNEFYAAKMGELIEKQGKVVEQKNQGKKAIVEFSSPNIAKPFTIGHLRSTIIGDAVANILAVTGYQVFRDNHLGDWGTQFGKLIVAIKQWGNIETISKSENPVKELVALYVKFHEEAEHQPELEDEAREWFKRLENGDKEARELWQLCIDWSWQEFDKIYQQLGVTFTENGGRGYGESYFENMMKPVIEELKQTDFLQEGKEGALLFYFPNDEFPPLMILKKDGSTLYATRDLATDKFRLEKYGKDILVINEVGAEQEMYFRQIFKIEELLEWYQPGQRVHVKHGHFRFHEGKMSTRKGNVIWLEEVLALAFDKAKVLMGTQGRLRSEWINPDSPKVSDRLKREDDVWYGKRNLDIQKVSISALKWNDLKRSSHLDVVFDWDEILNMQGNSGPYMQYTYARAKSVLKKGTRYEIQDTNIGDLEINPEELAILRLLSRFGEVVELAADKYEPHHIATYLYELAQAFNAFYNKHSILGVKSQLSGSNEQSEVKKQDTNTKTQFRLQLTAAVSLVIQEGLNLLGIETVEEM